MGGGREKNEIGKMKNWWRKKMWRKNESKTKTADEIKKRKKKEKKEQEIEERKRERDREKKVRGEQRKKRRDRIYGKDIRKDNKMRKNIS